MIIYVEREPQKHHPGLPSGSFGSFHVLSEVEASFVGGEDRGRGMVGLGWVGHAVKYLKFLRTATAKAIPASRGSRKTFSLQTPDKGLSNAARVTMKIPGVPN